MRILMWLDYYTVSLAFSEMRPTEMEKDGYSSGKDHIVYGLYLGRNQKIVLRYEFCVSVTCIGMSF